MDRDEALRLLKGGPDGVSEWNRRRETSEAFFNLGGAALRRTNLTGADLSKTYLRVADLRSAYLRDTDLRNADLVGADLSGAILTNTNLCEADLSGAILVGASIRRAGLQQINLDRARCGGTTFSDTNLSTAKNLHSIRHHIPSHISIDTLIRSRGQISEVFLRGCGLPDAWIANLPALIGALEPIQFYSVFISYSSKDTGFAERLHADLQSKGVRCWYAPEDLKIGERIRAGIDESIRVHDKLLMVLSRHSVASDWVEQEVETAMEQERSQKRSMLFPVRLDDAVMKVDSGWPAHVKRTRNIGDFRKWKDHDAYQAAFARLLRDLKAEEEPGEG